MIVIKTITLEMEEYKLNNKNYILANYIEIVGFKIYDGYRESYI